MIVHCHRCDTRFRVPDQHSGSESRCPECGALNRAEAEEVIDVEYALQKDTVYEAQVLPDTNDNDEIDNPRVFVQEDETPWGTERSYTVYIQRQMENNGLPCCSLGCLIFVLLSFLLVRGCMSLF